MAVVPAEAHEPGRAGEAQALRSVYFEENDTGEKEGFTNLKSQFATSSSTGHGGRRKLPLAFSKHGAIQAATVLSSPRAVEVSVYVVRAFVQLRELPHTWNRQVREPVLSGSCTA
ncbi:MAG: hypothetical protein V4757_11255 [Pseudomonadota bacterium]